jgi:hypothetical protein
MEVTISDRRTLTKLYASRHQRAQQKEKGQLSDELLALTKCGRCYGAWVLTTAREACEGGSDARGAR